MSESKTYWAEIRCNYMDDTDRFWRVDAWKTENESEEGKVIAYIDDIRGRVLYIDPLAGVDETVKELVEEKQKEIADRNKAMQVDLWDILMAHYGHPVEIAIYGDPDNPASVTLEDMEENAAILDAEIYNICARE